MRKKIDINNPIKRSIIAFQQARAQEALSVEPRVEHASLPIYRINAKSNKKNNLEQIATGIIVNIKEQYFVFSASHVFEQFGDLQIFIGGGDNNEILQIGGDRFSSMRGQSGTHHDDPVDASVFHIESEVSLRMKSIALTINDLDINTSFEKNTIFLVAGFRANKSRNYGNIIYSKPSVYPTIEIPTPMYLDYNLEQDIHIALAYDKEVTVNVILQKTPVLNGLSGGPIIRIVESKSISDQLGSIKRQVLSAITIEAKQNKTSTEKVLVGTKVYVHIKLIKKFLPELLKDFPEVI